MARLENLIVDPRIVAKYTNEIDDKKKQCRENRHRNYEQTIMVPYAPGNSVVKSQCSGCGDIYERPPTEGEIAYTPI